jgi:hypothetical protein
VAFTQHADFTPWPLGTMLLATPRTALAPGSTSALANIRVTNSRLAVAAAIAAATLIVVARRHIL